MQGRNRGLCCGWLGSGKVNRLLLVSILLLWIGPGTAAGAESAPGPAESATPAPIQLTAMAVSGSQIALTWSSPAGAKRYRIYRDGVSMGTTARISEFDSKLKGETRYCYRVVALDGITDKEFSPSSEVCTTTAETPPPDAGGAPPASRP